MYLNRYLNPLKDRKDFFLLTGVFFLLTALFFFKMIFSKDAPFYFDLFPYIYPNLSFLINSLSSGEIPFWNPYLKGGIPFLADPPIGFYYPLHGLFFFWEYPTALKIFLFLHYLIALGSAYYCARQHDISPEGSFLAGMTFAFSGYLISSAGVFTKLRGYVWIPLFFGLARKARKEESLKYAIFSGIAFVMVILAGHLFAGYFAMMFFTFEMMVEFFFQRKKESPSRLWKEGKLWALVVFVGLGFSACQWVPSVMILKESGRKGGVDSASRGKWNFPLERVPEYAMPGIQGFPSPEIEFDFNYTGEKRWSNSVYFGLVSLSLAFWALIRLPWRKKIFWGGIALFGFSMSLGKNLPLYPFVENWLPLLNRFRYPEKLIFWFTFASSFLCGFGYDFLFKSPVLEKKKLLFFPLGMALGVFLLPHTEANFLCEKGFPFYLQRFLLLSSFFTLLLVFRKKRWVGILLLGLCWADLYAINAREIFTQSTRLYSQKPQTIESLPPASLGDFRIMRYPFDPFLGDKVSLQNPDFVYRFIDIVKESLIGDLALAYEYEGLSGMSPATFWRYNELLVIHRPENRSWPCNLFGVKKILTNLYCETWIEQNFQLWKKFPDLKLAWYDNPKAFPRVKLYYQEKKVSSVAEAKKEIAQVDLDSCVVIEKQDGSPPLRGEPHKEDFARILSYHLNEVKIKVKVNSPCNLVLFDAHARGWRAWEGEKEIPIHYGFILFRSLRLLPGEHEITFSYTPPGFWMGWGIWGITGGFLLLLYLKRKSR